MSQRLAEPFLATGSRDRLTSSSSSTPSGRVDIGVAAVRGQILQPAVLDPVEAAARRQPAAAPAPRRPRPPAGRGTRPRRSGRSARTGPTSSCSRAASPDRSRRCRPRSPAPATRRRSASPPDLPGEPRSRLRCPRAAPGHRRIWRRPARRAAAFARCGTRRCEVDRLLDPIAARGVQAVEAALALAAGIAVAIIFPISGQSRSTAWKASSDGSAPRRLAATCGIRSMPTRSSRPKMPVLGMPSGRPMTASASSTVRPISNAALKAACIQ